MAFPEIQKKKKKIIIKHLLILSVVCAPALYLMQTKTTVVKPVD